ncbi:MAG: C40 family peptidase, partial [Oscillatoria sp. PMC 1076.18]|nr:C40 family peptidase [Oscillatoria sp. PMC 1076.18]
MVQQLPKTDSGEYCPQVDLNLYDAPKGDRLATQAAKGRHLQILTPRAVNDADAVEVRLCEDGYRAWLRKADFVHLTPATAKYQPQPFSRSEIVACLPHIIAFTKAALQQPNYYLWGGTVAPNYDCSGLMQAAFVASGIWLPRDSYQQADFTERIPLAEIIPGDLIFFAQANKVNHVALCLGDGYYIHSSGVEMGRNGIAIDQLSADGDDISRAYYQQFWGVGRV